MTAQTVGSAATFTTSLRTTWGRFRSLAASDLVLIMARRELLRFLAGPRACQGLLVGVASAALLALLIPLHRAFGGDPLDPPPYFLLYTVTIQLSLFFLWARTLWVGIRRNTATGSLEELLLTGAGAPQLLLGSWLGLAAAAILTTLMLLPLLMLAAAWAGASWAAVAAVSLAWSVTAMAGALAGALLLFSERSTPLSVGPLYLLIQSWFIFRWVAPRLGMGGWWSGVMQAAQQLDPLTLVPAAAGATHEAWPPKLLFLLVLVAAGVAWLGLADRDLPARPQRDESQAGLGDFLSLRPMRLWMTTRRGRRSPQYTRAVMYPFESAYGWRLRISPLAWICVSGIVLIQVIPAALIGREAHAAGVGLTVLELFAVTLIAALGAAASFAAEREQGRWSLLLCSGLRVREILLAKWRAAWTETWPLWLLVLVQTLLLVVGGVLPLRALLFVPLAFPLAAMTYAALSTALAARAPSLLSAQQRALLLVLAPPVACGVLALLLRQLPQVGYLSLPQLAVSALGFRPWFADTPQILIALAAYAGVGALMLLLAGWQLVRWPPVE